MRRLPLLLLPLLLAGCPGFLVDRGEIMDPTRSLEPPAVSALPKADVYVELAARWRRETRVGIGGQVEATLVDPGLAAAEVAHEAAVQAMGAAAAADMLASRWPVLFGSLHDRFPIDLEWRFDEQFISNRRILDPAQWEFTLVTSEGPRYAPLAASTLRALPAPRDGAWIGAVRLWFPWTDPERRTAVLAGGTSWVRLELGHPSGHGDVTWRFRTAW
jgi:hypothetical protein